MQLQQKYIITVLLLFMGVINVSDASAVDIKGRISSQYLWYSDIFTDKKQSELGEYLNISIINFDKNNKLSIQGYGRAAYLLNDIDDNTDRIKNRLYLLYVDYSELYKKIDIRFGRQFVNYTAGSALLDGGQIGIKNIGHIALSFMGGRNVFFDLIEEASSNDDLVYGAAVYLDGFRSTDAEISYFRKDDKDGIARDLLGASFKQYIFNSIKLYGNTRYDIISEVFNEILAGTKFYPTSDIIFTGEHYQSYLSFDNTSIYAVFAVDSYKEDVFRIDYTINDKISTNVSYTLQNYETDDATVYEAGFNIRPAQKLKFNLTYDKRNGYGGKFNGGMAELSYDKNIKLNFITGIHYDVYERDRITGEETARKYWIGSSYKFTSNMSASLRMENNVNINYDNNWQGRAVFNYDF